MIKLYSFGPSLGMIDPSPFVLKVDVFLRLANIEYQIIADLRNLKKSPKGKLPFIYDGENTVADSEFIISYLQEKHQLHLDNHLSKQQKSTAYLLGKSLDEHLYWCLVFSRWAKDDSWGHVKKALFGSMPFPLNKLVPPIARKSVISSLHKQGLGRHSDEEIHQIAQQIFQSLSDILANNQFFFGASACTFDATAFGFLAQFIHVSLDNKMNELARKHSNLVRYCDNIKNKYYEIENGAIPN